MPNHLVFDVNETLLDVAALDPFFEKLFGDTSTRKEWFFTLEENWLTATIVDDYKPFGELVKAALVMVGDRRDTEVTEEHQQALVEGMMQLPAHEGVPEALALLRDHGFSLTALTNGTLAAVKRQLESAKLAVYFDNIMSVDEVRRYKPASAPYEMAAQRLGIQIGDMTMIAAHAWDITGAQSAGCRTAFVSRPGKVLNPAGAVPELKAKDLHELSRLLIARAKEQRGG